MNKKELVETLKENILDVYEASLEYGLSKEETIKVMEAFIKQIRKEN